MSNKKFEKFVDNIQNQIIEKELNYYNKHIVELFHNPKNWGRLPEQDTSVWYAYEGPCGDTLEFFLKIRDNIIEKATFITDGCGASVATGCQTTLLIEGRTLEFAEGLKSGDIDGALKGLPEDHKHCAELAARTLKKAIMKYKLKNSNLDPDNCWVI